MSNEVAVVAQSTFLSEAAAQAEGIITYSKPSVSLMKGKVDEKMMANALAAGKSLGDSRDKFCSENDKAAFVLEVIGMAFAKGQVKSDSDYLEDAPIATIIDAKGEGYVSASPTLFKSLISILTVIGEPASWSKPYKFAFSLGKTRSGNAINQVKLV